MGFFTNFISQRVSKVIEKRIKENLLTKQEISSANEEIKNILIEADVNEKVISVLLKNISREYERTFRPDENINRYFLKVWRKNLQKILSANKVTTRKPTKQEPQKILFIGLQGSGKTTSVVKLAKFLRKKEQTNSIMVVGCDYQRPGAMKQLQENSEKEGFFFHQNKEVSVSENCLQALTLAQEKRIKFILFDTAGRLAQDEKLMKELEEIKKIIKPQEIIMVIDAAAGQKTIEIVKKFHEKLNITGFFISKTDSDVKGGIILSLTYFFSVPILFLGNSEKTDGIEKFYPERMAERLLGLGDLKTLTEEIDEKIGKRTIEKTIDRLLSGKFDLNDMRNQLQQASKVGELNRITSMLPGIGGNFSEKDILKVKRMQKLLETLINGSTYEERKNPTLLFADKTSESRQKRISLGSGIPIGKIKKILENFQKTTRIQRKVATALKAGKIPNFEEIKELFKVDVNDQKK